MLFTDKKTEAVTLTAAVVNGEPDKSASQTFRFGGNFSSSVSLSKEADGEIADGVTENRARIKVIKISGEPEYDTAVKMTLSPSLNATFDNNSKEKVVYTDVNGEVIAGFKDRCPEAVTLMAELNDQPASAKSETFTFSLVTRVADIIKVDNESSCKTLDVNEYICGITLQLLNKAGGVVPDTDVVLSVSQSATLTPPHNVRSDSSGKIRARVELTRSASITAGVEDYFSKTIPVR